MSNEQHPLADDREFGRNWVTSSRFMFYMQVLSFLAFVTGCSVNMYKATEYKQKPKVEVQESSLYTPKYKM
jgi:hypothetical protein